jgi:hypothetical protein
MSPHCRRYSPALRLGRPRGRHGKNPSRNHHHPPPTSRSSRRHRRMPASEARSVDCGARGCSFPVARRRPDWCGSCGTPERRPWRVSIWWRRFFFFEYAITYLSFIEGRKQFTRLAILLQATIAKAPTPRHTHTHTQNLMYYSPKQVTPPSPAMDWRSHSARICSISSSSKNYLAVLPNTLAALLTMQRGKPVVQRAVSGPATE